jgi:hypothetical protein
MDFESDFVKDYLVIILTAVLFLPIARAFITIESVINSADIAVSIVFVMSQLNFQVIESPDELAGRRRYLQPIFPSRYCRRNSTPRCAPLKYNPIYHLSIL